VEVEGEKNSERESFQLALSVMRVNISNLLDNRKKDLVT